jgi:hypothetical protein
MAIFWLVFTSSFLHIPSISNHIVKTIPTQDKQDSRRAENSTGRLLSASAAPYICEGGAVEGCGRRCRPDRDTHRCQVGYPTFFYMKMQR